MPTEIIAHRGASADAPENTLAAFRLAFRHGADGVEGDFRLTSDGRIVCFHDPSTRRLAGTGLPIAGSTFRKLRRLDVGAWKAPRWTGERIPSIDEVLSAVPRNKKIYIEIKCGRTILRPLEKALGRSGPAANQVVLISFSADVIARAKKRFPDHRALWIVRYREGRRPGTFLPSLDDILFKLEAIGADGLDSQGHRVVDRRFISTINRAGFELHLWTTGGVSIAKRFVVPGIRSITTNHPRALRAALRYRSG